MEITIAVGESRFSEKWPARVLAWTALCERLRQPVRTGETVAEYAAMSRAERLAAKDVGGFVGGALAGDSRKTGSVVTRQLLALDADYGSPNREPEASGAAYPAPPQGGDGRNDREPEATSREDTPKASGAAYPAPPQGGDGRNAIWDAWEMLSGCAACLHSTHSHTPDKPRLRLVVPLARAVSADEYEPIARRVASWLDIDAFDDTTYQVNRLMFWPSCPKDGEYLFQVSEGPYLDPDEVLATYTDWHDMRLWPRSARQETIIRKHASMQGDPLTKPGVIGAFNRAHSISSAIATYLPTVYTPCGANRWTYALGSSIGGAVVYDGDKFLYSHHDTDPTSLRLCSAFDLVRLHLYGALDVDADKPLNEQPSMAEMRRLCAGDPAVCAEIAEGVRRDPSEVFQDDESLERFDGDTTEQGAAKDFTDQYGGAFRWNGAFGWMFWDGQRWALNAEPEVTMLAMRYADTVYGEARAEAALAGDKYTKARAAERMRLATRLRSATGLKAILTLSRAIVNVNDANAYDANPWDLNTPGGIIDLRTGVLRAHDPNARCTKITAVSLGGAGDQRWEAFIQHVTGGDADFARYLQTLAGMAAVGAVMEEGMLICHGEGGNGKSTLFGVLRRVLGDYATSCNADVLTSHDGRVDQSYIAALRGVRLAIMGETEEGARFSVAQMKRVTSRDAISARALYKDPITFTPTHTVVMHTNHLPKLSSLDGGTRRRIAVASFPATLPPEKVITNYESVLFDACGGEVLRWIVDGAMRFYAAGCKLDKPRCVAEATEAYLQDEDWLLRFTDECCETGAERTVGGGELYAAYRAWTERSKEYGRRPSDFAHALERAGYRREKRMSGTVWFGLRLMTDEM